jgi:hypothetical protein
MPQYIGIQRVTIVLAGKSEMCGSTSLGVRCPSDPMDFDNKFLNDLAHLDSAPAAPSTIKIFLTSSIRSPLRDLAHTQKKNVRKVLIFTNPKKILEHIELPARLLDCFLRSNKSNISQTAC